MRNCMRKYIPATRQKQYRSQVAPSTIHDTLLQTKMICRSMESIFVVSPTDESADKHGQRQTIE